MAQYLSKNLDLSVQGMDNENLIMWLKRRYQGKNYVIQCNLRPKNKLVAFVTFGPVDTKDKYLSVKHGEGIHLSLYDKADFKDDLRNKFGFEPSVVEVIVTEVEEILHVCVSFCREPVEA